MSVASPRAVRREDDQFFGHASSDEEGDESGSLYHDVASIQTGHVPQTRANIVHPSDGPRNQPQPRRSSFFGHLEEPVIFSDTRASSPKSLPPIPGENITHQAETRPHSSQSQHPSHLIDAPNDAPMSRGQRLARNAVQQRASTFGSQEARARPESFFGIPEPAPSSRASDIHPAQPIPRQPKGKERAGTHNQHASLGQIAEPFPTDQYSRPSSFYGMDAQLRTGPSSANISRHPSPAPSSVTQSTTGTYGPPSRHVPTMSSQHSSMYAGSINGDSIPPPLLNHSHLQPGTNAALLSHAKTLELYRTNARKTNDPDVMYEFATFMLNLAKEMGDISESSAESAESPEPERQRRRSLTAVMTRRKASATASASSSSSSILPRRSPQMDHTALEPDGDQSISSGSDMSDTKRNNLMLEAAALLKKLADRGHAGAQSLLASLYAEGLLNAKGKFDYDRAFPLWVLAGKHGDTDAAFRAGQCCEHGWGCRKEQAKAVGWYKKSAAAMHPGAMLRLGLAEIRAELGLPRKPREGFKWLKRAAEMVESDEQPSRYSLEALFELGILHEKGIEHVVFVDLDYATECYARAGERGHAPSAYRLGAFYEYGRQAIPQDAALSIHYYNIAAQQDHPEACFALTAWYLVGAPGVLPQSDTEAFLWAKKAAEHELAKAEYALGYFTEMGIGSIKDNREATYWYERAANHGDKRAVARLSACHTNATAYYGALDTDDTKSKKYRFAREQARRQISTGPPGKGGKDSDCIIS